MEYGVVYLVLAAAFGLFMAWGIGANDVANAMAPSVGSKVLTIRQAVVVAAIFEFAGAVLAGGEVTATIRSGIVETGALEDSPELLVFGMLAALASAGTWLLIASKRGWPVSTTHSIIGALVGFAIAAVGWSAVQWGVVGTVVASWVVSPVLAGIASFVLFRSVQYLVLDNPDPLRAARLWVPIYIGLTAFVIASVTMVKGLSHLGLELTEAESYGYALAFAVGMWLVGKGLVARIGIDPSADRDFHFASVERVFGVLMVVVACAMAFAHGSNDVANAIGPVAAVVSVVTSGGDVGAQAELPLWILLLGGGGIVAGLFMLGHHVIATVGSNITQLTPSRGFACGLATAGTVVFASGFGLPISTTQTLVGAVLGIGLARGIAALNLRVVGGVFMSWLVTLPAGGILAIFFFYLLLLAFGG